MNLADPLDFADPDVFHRDDISAWSEERKSRLNCGRSTQPDITGRPGDCVIDFVLQTAVLEPREPGSTYFLLGPRWVRLNRRVETRSDRPTRREPGFVVSRAPDGRERHELVVAVELKGKAVVIDMLCPAGIWERTSRRVDGVDSRKLIQGNTCSCEPQGAYRVVVLCEHLPERRRVPATRLTPHIVGE